MKRVAEGIALVVTLTITVIVAVLLILGTIWVTSGLQGNAVSSTRNELVQLADGLSDQARIQLVYRYQTNRLNTRNYIKSLAADIGRANEVALGSGTTAAWAIKRVSDATERYGWVDVHATVRRGQNTQTVVRRVSFGDNQVFNLAMLAETTNCMYCHLRVKGDVGSLDFLRPGWGSEGGSGHGSGGNEGGSVVDGDMYVAPSRADKSASNVTADASQNTDPQDPTRTTTLNGATLTGKLNLRYTGSMLPDDTDGDGVPDFPPIDRDTAVANATGRVSGGAALYGVPLGGNVLSARSPLLAVNGVYNGNLTLVGTPDNPVVLDGDIYATGDVIIKGYVTGRGAIYSGRNTYVAGDLIAKNRPDRPGEGVCAAVAPAPNDTAEQKNTKNNTCARANIAAGKDEIRLGARGSTILGDYAERDAAGAVLPFDKRQSADYYREQFGLNSPGKKFYFDRLTGDELSRKADDTYWTVDDRQVSSGNVLVTSGGPPGDPASEAYSYAMRPGAVGVSGRFTPWMDDATYRALVLGEEEKTFNTWRASIGGKRPEETLAQYQTRLLPALTASGIADDLALIVLTSVFTGVNGDFKDEDMTIDVSGRTLRVLVNEARRYETQVKRVDAFLYANRRIAGKTSMSPLSINGGMIAKEIGILAPGRLRPGWAPNEAPYSELNDRSRACGPGTASYVADTEDCAFTVNYDYRLRNGGYGYNLVTGNVGQTIIWKIADAAVDQVGP